MQKKATHVLNWKIERKHWREGRTWLIGMDEAGRGPLAGPVVAAAVMFTPEVCKAFPKELADLNDSKQVTEENRERLFGCIIQSALAFGIGIISPTVIDEINILQATMQAMTAATEELVSKLSGITPEMLLVDGKYFRTRMTYPFQAIVDGDAKSPLIAAASILAKVTRDRIMRELDHQYPMYKFAKHKGYGTKEHRDAIDQFGLSPVHRMSFRKELAIKKNLELFAELRIE
ncbi:MAG: ribonuclease HII [Candidatus Kapaibacterium sp.]